MDIKHFQYILTIAQQKSITKAAEKLYISQSSLSYTVSSIEKEIGTPLFIRHKGGVTLTPAGEKYYSAAKKIVSTYDNLINDLHTMNETVKINIAASSVWGTHLFSELIPDFRKKHPNVTFHLTQAELFYLNAELEQDSIDFAFLSLSPFARLSPNMHVLRKEELMFAVPVVHPYFKKNSGDTISADDFVNNFSSDTFILSRVGSSNQSVVQNLFEQLGFTPANIFEVNGLALTRTMISKGDDVAFIPTSGCTPDDCIHYYHFESDLYRYNVLLTKPQSNYDDVKKAFYKYVLAHFQKSTS